MAFDTEFIKEEVLHSLGVDGVTVELTDKDIDVCIKSALRVYNRWNPLRDRESIEVTAGGLKSIAVHPDTYAVEDVQFQDTLNVLEGRDHIQFNIFNAWQMIGAGYGAGGFGDPYEYAVLKQWRDMTRREFSLEPDWYFEEDVQFEEGDDETPMPRKIHFYNPTGLGLRVMYIALRPRTSTKQVQPRDHDWIIEWVLAEAKEILGRKRGKFPQGVPTAGGQTLMLDGIQLLEEAKETKAQLKADIIERFPLPPPLIG